MIRPFPTSPDERKAVAAQMKAEAPELMDDIAELRKHFPGARMTHFKAGDLELGKRPVDGGVGPTADQILLAGRPAREEARRLEKALADRKATKSRARKK